LTPFRTLSMISPGVQITSACRTQCTAPETRGTLRPLHPDTYSSRESVPEERDRVACARITSGTNIWSAGTFFLRRRDHERV